VTKLAVALWQTYLLRGEPVMVVQQWHDAFGRRMLRIEAVGDDLGEGMLEDIFLQNAEPKEPPSR
jgi:hypothetical protein